MAKKSAQSSPTPAIKLDPSRLLTHIQLAEGGAFAPTSFRGYIERGSMYCPHRILSADNEARMIEKGIAPDDNPGYKLCIRLTFRVLEVLEPQDGSFDRETFSAYISLGGKSLHYLFATNDGINPAGDDEANMRIYAKGYMGDDAKPSIVHMKGPAGDEENLSIYDGRWVACYESTPESRRRLESKSGYVQFMAASAPTLESTEPSAVVTITDKKGNATKLFNVDAPGPDGLPLGSTFFDGLSGVWDTKKIVLEDLKDKDGKPAVQRVLMLTSYDGRVDENGTLQGAQPSNTPAPALTTQAAPAPATPGAAAGSVADRVRLLIPQRLAVGAPTNIQLAIQSIITSGVFSPAEMFEAMTAADQILKSSPPSMTPEIAQALVTMGGLPVVFNPETQSVLRVV